VNDLDPVTRAWMWVLQVLAAAWRHVVTAIEQHPITLNPVHFDPLGGWGARIETGFRWFVVALALLVAWRLLGILRSIGRGLSRTAGAAAVVLARRRAGGGAR
jgi:hypothetical protein